MSTLHYGKLYTTDLGGNYRKAPVGTTCAIGQTGATDCSPAVLSAVSLIDDKIDSYNIMTGKMAYTGSTKSPKLKMLPEIDKVIFNNPATVVIWSDGTKTIVKTRQKGRKKDKFSKEYGLAMAIAKKYCGNRCRFMKMVKEGKDAG